MKMETRVALSNMKYYKHKNIIIGIAIFLTSFLLFLVPTVGMDMINGQFAVINKIYPTWHAVFRNVDADTVHKLSSHHDIGTHGVKSTLGYISNEDARIIMLYMDKEAYDLYRIKLTDGTLPKNENDIVVSKGMLKVMGKTASVGDTITLPYQIYRNGGLDYKQEGQFKICGLIDDGEEGLKKDIYTVFMSKDFLVKEVPDQEVTYDFLFQVVGKKNAYTDDIEDQINALADQFQLKEDDIGINQAYLMANYIDPSFVPAVVLIMAIIVLAGIITIYSIYFVNIPERVQEFGRLKSIGATRGQIRRIVLREGMGITLIALPIGLIMGTVLAKVIMFQMMTRYQDNGIIISTMKQMMDQGEIKIYYGWIYLLTIGITILTVYLSLMRPMRVASRISEIDAMHFGQDHAAKKKTKRKSHLTITIPTLSRIYLFGKKKNTIVTILSMGITGIFVMVIATILSCANPRESANGSVLGQYQIFLDVESGNKEHPEKEWKEEIQNNPLTEDLKHQIEQIDGIKSVSCFNAALADVKELPGEAHGIGGVPKEYEKQLMDGIIEGHTTYEELKTGKTVIVDKNLLHWYPNIKVGDTLNIVIDDGNGKNTAKVRVAAIGDYPIGFTSYNYLLMAYDGVCQFSDQNINYSYEIFANQDYNKATCEKLKEITDKNDLLDIEIWQDRYVEWKTALAMTSRGCYAFLAIISMICVMNMIKTMINGVQIRKKEIGKMQAMGMTDQQLNTMLQQEGLFYTLGTLVVSVGLGSILGYPVYRWAKWNSMFNIERYHYPWVAAVVVCVVLLLIQALLTIALVRSVQKQSLIDRIRFSE